MKTAHLPELTLRSMRKTIRRELGLNIDPGAVIDFSEKIAAASRELGFGSPSECIHSLVSRKPSKHEIEVLAGYLTIGETYFFRDPKSFAVLEQHILPSIIRNRKETKVLRIWSAACATGEEPYSLAMLLIKLLPEWREWRITILATDINTKFLGKAIKGRYTNWSFRTIPSWAKSRFFTRAKDGSFEIAREVREMVTFSYLNLAEDTYPSVRNDTNAMDLILCRNVLIYFGEEMREHVIAGLYRSLTERGCLMVSSVEASHRHFRAFSTRRVGEVTLYCRGLDKKIHDSAAPLTALKSAPLKTRSKMSPPSEPPSQTESPPVTEVPFPKPELTSESQPEESECGQKERYHHALGLYKQGLYEKAIEELLSCPKREDAVLLLARSYANLGDFDQARKWCDTVIEADPLHANARYLRASILHESGNVEEAVTGYRQTLYIEPNFILAHFSLANLLSGMGKKAEAQRHYHNACCLAAELPEDELLPESDGLPAGKMVDLIKMREE